jgi:N-acetylmuramoyl-L-alanine amidase
VRKFLKSLIFVCVFFLNINNVFALQKAKILNLRTQNFQDYIRFVIDLSQKPTYKTLTLSSPERVVIDINNTDHNIIKSDFEAGETIDSIRTGRFSNGVRIVLDINTKAKIIKDFILSPSQSKKNWRLVVDISKNSLNKSQKSDDVIGELIARENVESLNIEKEDRGGLDNLIESLVEEKKQEAQKIEKPSSVRRRKLLSDSDLATPKLKPNLNEVKKKQAKLKKLEGIKVVLRDNRNIVNQQDNIGDFIDNIADVKTATNTRVVQTKRQTPTGKSGDLRNRSYGVSTSKKRRKYNIVIDAGHGGKDPGAIGRRRTKEKNLTLQYAKLLRKELQKTGRYNVYLTRKGDYFISLNKRVKIARKLKADLFISVHADSSKNRRARGLSVYTLSQRASDTRTARLAKKENKADIIGGLNLYGEYQDTINVLVDLSRREAMNSSGRLAEIMIKEMKRSKMRTLGSGHKYGNFAVLLAPDTASILIELGFLSNKADEHMMKTWAFKQKMVKGIIRSVDRYFAIK